MPLFLVFYLYCIVSKQSYKQYAYIGRIDSCNARCLTEIIGLYFIKLFHGFYAKSLNFGIINIFWKLF